MSPDLTHRRSKR